MRTSRIGLLLGATLALGLQPNPAVAGTLADALDAPDLVWTTGGIAAQGWKYTAGSGAGDTSFDGMDSAEVGQTSDLGESWLSTTVVGPGTISFWWYAYTEPEADLLEFYIDEMPMDRISGILPGNPSDWQYRSFEVPPGTNTLTWKYFKDYGSTGGTEDVAYLDQVRFVTNNLPLQAALNTRNVEWSSGGNTNETVWFAQSDVSHDGALAARSGDVHHGQTNWVEASLAGITNVSFWWKVSSETNRDVLEFFTNGVFAKRISGEVNWQSNYFRLPVGRTNTVRWAYRRDSSVTAGQNCGWLDEVKFGGQTITPSRYDIGSFARLPNGDFRLAVVGEIGAPCRVEVSSNLVHWVTLTNFTTLDSNSIVTDTEAAAHDVRFYRVLSP